LSLSPVIRTRLLLYKEIINTIVEDFTFLITETAKIPIGRPLANLRDPEFLGGTNISRNPR